MASDQSAREPAWRDAAHLEEWAGEVRINLIRLAAILVFYGYHLVNVYLLKEDPTVAGRYHAAVTGVVAAWTVAVLVLYASLSRRYLPGWLKYAATAWDTAMIAGLVALAGGPKSPIVYLLFLVVAAAPLRLCLRFVYAATGLALAAYILLLGHYVFFIVGAEKYYATAELRVPRTEQAFFLLTLATAGFLAGQVVRQAQRMAKLQ